MRVVWGAILVLGLALNASAEDYQDWDCSNPFQGAAAADLQAYNEYCAKDARQRLEIREHYKMARILYTQGDFLACVSELDLLQKKISAYHASSDIRIFCEQAMSLEARGRTRCDPSVQARTPASSEKFKRCN
jgi:hypothetical protein